MAKITIITKKSTTLLEKALNETIPSSYKPGKDYKLTVTPIMHPSPYSPGGVTYLFMAVIEEDGWLTDDEFKQRYPKET